MSSRGGGNRAAQIVIIVEIRNSCSVLGRRVGTYEKMCAFYQCGRERGRAREQKLCVING